MDYSKWAAEYFIEAEKIYKMLYVLKKQYKEQKEETNRELARRMMILYSMYLDCKHTGELLSRRGGENIAFKPNPFS